MSFPHLISAFRRGSWLIEKGYAEAAMPLVIRMLSGERVDFGIREKTPANGNNSVPIVRLKTYGATAYSVRVGSNVSRLPLNSIAVVSINGPILKFGDDCSYGMVDYVSLIEQLTAAENIAGIIIDMDSPGGMVSGTAMTADAIVRAGQQKPVIGFIDSGMAASAGAWIISACPEVYMSQAIDQIGSIGVFTTIADFYSYYEAFHKLPVRDIYAPQSTDKNKDYRDALEGNDDLIKEELRTIADQFIKTIKRNRKGKLTSNEWQTGKMFYAEEAKRIGLIDGIKSFEAVVDRMNKLINK